MLTFMTLRLFCLSFEILGSRVIEINVHKRYMPCFVKSVCWCVRVHVRKNVRLLKSYIYYEVVEISNCFGLLYWAFLLFHLGLRIHRCSIYPHSKTHSPLNGQCRHINTICTVCLANKIQDYRHII